MIFRSRSESLRVRLDSSGIPIHKDAPLPRGMSFLRSALLNSYATCGINKSCARDLLKRACPDLMQILVNGLITGATIALLAVAFASVYIPTRIFYVALAGVYTVVPFVAWSLLQHGATIWMAALIAVASGTGLSLLFEI